MFNDGVIALSKAPASTVLEPEVLLAFFGNLVLKFIREDPDNQSFILDLKTIILPRNNRELNQDNSIFKQLIQCYAELYPQVRSDMQPIVQNLAIAHVILGKNSDILNYTLALSQLALSGELPQYFIGFQELVTIRAEIRALQ